MTKPSALKRAKALIAELDAEVHGMAPDFVDPYVHNRLMDLIDAAVVGVSIVAMRMGRSDIPASDADGGFE